MPNRVEQHAVFVSLPFGGGHKAAKEAVLQQKKREWEQAGVSVNTSKYDLDLAYDIFNSIHIPFIGKLGDYMEKGWAEAQKKGDVNFLAFSASFGWLGDFLLYPLVYFKVKNILENMASEPKAFIMTQAASTPAIVAAVEAVNRKRNWNVHVDMYMTDIPSDKAINFTIPIKITNLFKSWRNILRVHTKGVHLKNGQQEADFWKEHCGSVNIIKDDHYPVREAFLKTQELKNKLSQESLNISLKLNYAAEQAFIEKGMSNQDRYSFNGNETCTIAIDKKDKVGFVMLGSQPASSSVIGWVDTFIEAHKKSSENGIHTANKKFVFLYCGKAHGTERNSILDEVEEYIDLLRKQNRWPENLNIIPFTNQSSDEIATLMARADVTVTRSGGSTAMELDTLFDTGVCEKNSKTTFIHFEALQYNGNLLATRKKVLQAVNQFFQEPLLERQKLETSLTSIFKKYAKNADAKKILTNAIPDDRTILSRSDQQKIEKEIDIFIQKEREALRALQNAEIEKEVQILRTLPKYHTYDDAALRKRAIDRLLIHKGSFLWEGKNAKYLMNQVGAIMTNPELAQEKLISSFFC